MKQKSVFYFFFLAFKDILSARLFALLLMPFLASLIVWGSLSYFLWDELTLAGVALFKSGFIQSIVLFLSNYFTIGHEPFVLLMKFFFLFGFILPLAFLTALLLTSIFLVPVIVEQIRKADFPTILKKSNSVFAGTTATLSLSAKYLFSWIGTLPLWLIIPGGSLIVPFLLLSWFNSRLFTWEVMVEIASQDETSSFIKEHSLDLWYLGLLTSTLYFIPVINFIAPVITAAAFSRFCLKRKQEHFLNTQIK